MPSHGLIRQFGDLFEVEEDWRWNGAHYQRTARDWLASYDAASRAGSRPVLREAYGKRRGAVAAALALFFLATAGLFGHCGGRNGASATTG